MEWWGERGGQGPPPGGYDRQIAPRVRINIALLTTRFSFSSGKRLCVDGERGKKSLTIGNSCKN